MVILSYSYLISDFIAYYMMEILRTSLRVSSGFGIKFSLPLTNSMYNGGSCSSRGRNCFIKGGLRFRNCFRVISACTQFITQVIKKGLLSVNPHLLLVYMT